MLPNPVGRVQALIETNNALEAENTQLQQALKTMEAAKLHLEQRIKLLQLGVAILLAACGALTVGLVTGAVGAPLAVSVGSATVAFIGLITATIAVLNYLRSSNSA